MQLEVLQKDMIAAMKAKDKIRKKIKELLENFLKEYDKIEKKYALPLLPISFTKTEYHEATVKHTETVISDEIEMRRKKFLEELQKENMELIELTENTTESDNAVNITFSADCRVRTDKEIPVKYSEGDKDGENS